MNDGRRCPRCGQLNSCAQAEQKEAVEECWCFHQPVDFTVLDSLPADQRDRECFCPRCAQGLPVTSPKAD